MSDNKTDWSKTESLMGQKERPGDQVPTGRLEKPDQPLVPQVLLRPIAELDNKPGGGLVGFVAGLHGEGKAKKQAALKALSLRHNAEIDMLEARLTQLVRVQKVHADIGGRAIPQALDARKLEALDAARNTERQHPPKRPRPTDEYDRGEDKGSTGDGLA